MHISIRPQLGHLFGLEESSLVQKANPYHDALGRFSTKSTATFVSAWAKTKPDLMHVPASDTRKYLNLDIDDLGSGSADGGGDAKAYKGMDTDHKAYLDSLPKEQMAAVLGYTGSDYGRINEFLRGETEGEPLEDSYQDKLDNLNTAMSGKTLGVDVQAYRGVSSGPFANKLKNAHSAGELVGTSLQDPGFVSSTVSEGLANNWAGPGGVVLNLNVKKEQNALYVGGRDHKAGLYTEFPHEHEMILPRNTIMLITKSEVINGRLHVSADVLPSKPGRKAKV